MLYVTRIVVLLMLINLGLVQIHTYLNSPCHISRGPSFNLKELFSTGKYVLLRK